MFIHRSKSKRVNVKIDRHKKNFHLMRFLINPRFMFLLGMLILTIFFTVDFSFTDKIFEQSVVNTSNVDFRIKVINIINNDRVSKQEILKMSRVKKGDVLLSKDIFEIKSELESHAWIKNANVQRVFPDTLKIKIIESKPHAVLKTKGRYYLVNECGERLEKVTDQFEIAEYIELTGKNAEQNFYSLIDDLYKFKSVYENIAALEFKGERRWNVVLKNGSYIKLPEEGVAESLRFLEKNKMIDDLPLKKVEVDLRFTPEKMYVKF